MGAVLVVEVVSLVSIHRVPVDDLFDQLLVPGSVEEKDRHITTFITPWGRMRYCVAPQGSISSGDGYTYLFDMLLRHMPRMKKCVDDVVGRAKTLLPLFHDVTNFLSHTSFHGTIQNPKKIFGVNRKSSIKVSG